MFDIKYHITSLVAVFLALGLGIIIGTALMENGELLNLQEGLIKQLSTDIKSLDGESAKIKAQLADAERRTADLEGFAQRVYPMLAANRLFGREITIMAVGDEIDAEYLAYLRDILEDAGGSVRVVVNIKKPIGTLLSLLPESVAEGAEEDNEGDEILLSGAASIVAESVLGRGKPDIISSIQSEGFADYIYKDDIGKIDTVLIVGGDSMLTQSPDKDIALPLINVFKKKGLGLVGTKVSNTKTPYEHFYTGQGVIYIKDVDSIPGKFGLILALAEDDMTSDIAGSADIDIRQLTTRSDNLVSEVN